jgi:hypothetical protein
MPSPASALVAHADDLVAVVDERRDGGGGAGQRAHAVVHREQPDRDAAGEGGAG